MCSNLSMPSLLVCLESLAILFPYKSLVKLGKSIFLSTSYFDFAMKRRLRGVKEQSCLLDFLIPRMDRGDIRGSLSCP